MSHWRPPYVGVRYKNLIKRNEVKISDVELNPTVDGYRGSIGRLVFKRYKGRTIVGKKPVRTKELTPGQLAHTEHFKEAVAYAKSVLANPSAREFYRPIAFQRDISIYNCALGDYLKVPTIKPLNLTQYKGRVDDAIEIKVVDDIGLADLEVVLQSLCVCRNRLRLESL